jgi:hypothetical protein
LRFAFTLPDDAGIPQLTGEDVPLGVNVKDAIAQKRAETSKPYSARRV